MADNNALMKALGAELDKMAKDVRVPDGLHTFDHVVTLKISGSAIQNEDQEYTPTAEIPLLAVLARIVERTGWSGDNVIRHITEAATEALNAGEPVGEYIEHTKAAMRKVKEAVTKKLPKKIRSGAFKRTIKLDVLQVAQSPTL